MDSNGNEVGDGGLSMANTDFELRCGSMSFTDVVLKKLNIFFLVCGIGALSIKWGTHCTFLIYIKQ